MKKIFQVVFAALAPAWMCAQSFSPTVISSTGAFSSNANGSVSYTVGELALVQTFSAGGTILTQGFQQPNDNITGLIDLTKDDFGSFALYPNPAVDNVWFGFQFPESGKVTLAVYNTLGQKVADVYNGNYDSGKTTDGFAVSNFSAGSYFLSLTFVSDKDNKTHLISKPFQILN